MIIPIAFGAVIVSGLTWAWLNGRKALASANVSATSAITHGITDNGAAPPGMVRVQLEGDIWEVSKDYIGPIGINEAANLAKSRGMELPSPSLVDAIWRQADLKLLPRPRENIISDAVFADQKERIAKQIDGREYKLLGGAFKDVVTVNGHNEIYGWHVEDGKSVAGVPLHNPVTPGPGKVIQPPSGKRHDSPGAIGFKDYSQGARLVRKLAPTRT